MNPNDIVGTPREYEVWLAPDWSDWDEKRSKGSGWTRVSVRETLYADGRRIVQVLDENRQPITHQNLSEEIDKEQEKRYKDAQAKAEKEEDKSAPPGGIPTRTINGQVFQWNPQTRAYDIPTGQAPATTTQVPGDAVPRIEGTPLPGGGFDNEQPIKVWRRPDGTVVKSESLSAAERQQWQEDRERSRNPGGKTDAEIRAEQDRNRPGAPTLKPDGKGGTIAVQTMPDGSIRTTPLPGVPSDRPAPDRVTVEGTVYERDPNTGQYRPAPGIPSAAAGEPAGAPQAVDVIGRTAQNLREYGQWLNSQIELNRKDPTQGLTPAQADRLLDQRIKLANAAVQEQQGVVNTQTGVYGQQITDRGQSLRDAESRRNNVQGVYTNLFSTFAPLARYAGKGGGEALGQAILAGMDYYISKANQVGGWRDVPSPTLGPAATAVTGMGLPGAPYTGGPAAGERLTYTEMQDPNIVRGSVDAPPPPAFLPEAQAAQEALRQQAAATAAGVNQNINRLTQPPAAPSAAPQATGMDASDPAQQGQVPLPPAPPVGTGAPGVTVQPVLSAPQNNLPPAIAIPPTGTLPMPPAAPVMPPAAGNEAGGNVQMAPAFLHPYQQSGGINLSSPALQEMLADSWMPNSIIAQALNNVMGRGRAA